MEELIWQLAAFKAIVDPGTISCWNRSCKLPPHTHSFLHLGSFHHAFHMSDEAQRFVAVCTMRCFVSTHVKLLVITKLKALCKRGKQNNIGMRISVFHTVA